MNLNSSKIKMLKEVSRVCIYIFLALTVAIVALLGLGFFVGYPVSISNSVTIMMYFNAGLIIFIFVLSAFLKTNQSEKVKVALDRLRNKSDPLLEQ